MPALDPILQNTEAQYAQNKSCRAAVIQTNFFPFLFPCQESCIMTLSHHTTHTSHATWHTTAHTTCRLVFRCLYNRNLGGTKQ